jgi:perosamine synthetase
LPARIVKATPTQTPVPHSRPWLTGEDRAAVSAVLDSSMIAAGEASMAFEAEAARYLHQAGGVATPDGTTALFLALRALGIRAGDEVVIPAYVCDAVAKAVRWTRATPVLCDIGHDWCVNADTVKARLSERTRAVVVVHTFGIVADVEPIARLGVPVVEDLAQAFGASTPAGMAGGFGRLAMTSFHATKCLTTGEGGMVFSRDEGVVAELRKLKDSAYRLPLSDVQAALGLSQLRRYGEFLERRAEIAARYGQEIHGRFTRPEGISSRTMHFRYPVLLDGERVPELMADFHSRGVLVRRGVDALLHGDARFPASEHAFRRTLSLPLHPSMTHDEVDRVIQVANQVLGS